ncbi:MAG TPA: alpha/beta hydrolase fold domain-containing protein [Gammaproteobacteria bacterium]
MTRFASKLGAGALGSTLLLLVAPLSAEPGLLRTAAVLDDERGYCIDVAGNGGELRLDEPLETHTCKYGAPLQDQLFELRAEDGRIEAVAQDRCLAAEALEPGARLHLRACDDSALQRWSLAWGRLRAAAAPELCAAVAPGAGELAATPPLVSPVYRRRALTLEACGDSERQAFRWSSPDERGSSLADTLRSGMPPAVAAQLASFGRVFNGTVAGKTAQIYAELERVYAPEELEVRSGLAYGPHERQRLDVYRGKVRRSQEPVPMIAVFHGGGLIGGDRRSTANVAAYFGSIGWVGVTAGYRLAPEHVWPEGARDVGAVVTWLRDHAAELGGDPERIFVAGISTGALHVATYVFMPQVLLPGTPRAAGGILVSGPYTFDFARPGRGELAYYGTDPSLYPQRVVPGNVTRTDIPVLFFTAQWDSERYTVPFAQLYSELVIEHGVVPRYRQSLGHNHSSQLLSIGTSDTSVSSEIIDFVLRTTEEH